MAKPTADPWLDDETKVDFTPHAEDKELAALATEPHDTPTYDPADFVEPEDKPGETLLDYLKRAAPDAEVSVPEKLAQPAAEPAPEPAAEPEGKPEVHTYPDGSTLTVEKTKKGWKAVCDTGIEGVAPEVFYGATKDEMWQNVAAGKINATKKIREQNRRIKLEAVTEPVAPEPVVTTPAIRELTADEVFEIRTALESNPDLAFTTWFQKKTGMTLEDLVKLTKKGASAAEELDAESVARGFFVARPDYYNLDYNRDTITGWLTKKYLHKTLIPPTVDSKGKVTDPGNADDLFNRLLAGGHWTVENLCEAYDDLSASGLLELRPEAAEPEPEPEPEPVQPPAARAAEPVTPPTDERIVRTVRRPRAGLGLSSRETAPAVRAASSEKPPSAEDLDNLTDAQIAELWAKTRQAARLQPNRR